MQAVPGGQLGAIRTGERPQEIMLGAQLSARSGETVTLATAVRGG